MDIINKLKSNILDLNKGIMSNEFKKTIKFLQRNKRTPTKC